MQGNPPPRVRYVLDTDTVTYQQRGRPAVVERLAQIAPNHVATTVITLHEQLRGRLAAINRQQSDEELRLAYERLQSTHMYYCRVHVLPFNDAAAALYRQFVNQGLRIGAHDLRIAAITRVHDAVLVTSNRRHFDRIPELRIEDWNQP